MSRKHIFLERFVILLTLVLLSSHMIAGAQETGRVTVVTGPAVIAPGNSWTLTITADYPVIEDVSIAAPDIPAAFTQTRFLKFPRGTAGRMQTVFEYRFTANTSGRFTFEPFTVITPEWAAGTNRITVNVQDPDAQNAPVTLRLFWEGVPQRLAAGEIASLSLRAGEPSEGLPPDSVPPPGFFMPEVPPGVILSLDGNGGRETGVMCKFNLVLIDADLSLGPRVLRYENFAFEIPGVVIRREEGIRKNFTTEDTETRREEDAEALLFDPAKIKELEKARALRLAVFFLCTAALLGIIGYFAFLLTRQRKS